MTEKEKRIVTDLQKFVKRYRSFYSCHRVIAGTEDLMESAADMIERLSAELEAAKNDMNHIAADACLACRHIDKAANIGVKRKGTPCENCGRYSLKFEWRGLCDENGGARDESD